METLLQYANTPAAHRVLGSAGLVVLGAVLGWLTSRWRRFRQQRQVESGDAREVATVEKILIDRDPEGHDVLRIRTCGRDTIDVIFPNPFARDAFHDRTLAATTTHPLITMEGKMGSYLLYELAIWVCGQVAERDFPHEVWIMAAVCEPGNFGGHTSTTILLVRRSDLARFHDWATCKTLHVEHSSHGERILTLRAVAQEFERQHVEVTRRQAEGRRSNFEETMYTLDLRLDARCLDLPSKPVPWGRFEETLKALGLE